MEKINGHCHQEKEISPPPLVKTKLGTLKGFRIKLSTSSDAGTGAVTEADIFLGIPYAKPPIGKLRFEKPEPVEPWSGVRKATEFGPASFPLNFEELDETMCPISEDSLTLNIFRPAASKPSISDSSNVNGESVKEVMFPVIVYVHGGGYCSENARDYGYQGWSETFVSRGLIFVTIQYRLGPFGFLSLGNETLPGNLGLWDQALAFHFLHENITAFGGDPTKITAMGLSAGGASVAALALSPHSRNLIARTVEMSGTVLPEWSASERTVESSAKFIACLLEEPVDPEIIDTKKTEAIKNKLKQIPLEKFKKAIRATGTRRLDLNLLKFTPRIDGDFFPRDFPILLREQSPIPCFMSLVENEALYFGILGKYPFINEFGVKREELSRFGEADFRTFVKDCVVGGQLAKFLEKRPPKMLDEATNEIANFYLDKLVLNGLRDHRFYLKAYSLLLSDILFNVPVFWMAELRQQLGRPTYLYFNEYFNEAQFDDWVPLKDMNGLFPIGNFEFNESDNKHKQTISEMLSSFAKTGVPTISIDKKKVEWPANNKAGACEERLKFMKIDRNNRLSICEIETIRKSVDFWTEFCRKYEFNVIRGIPNKNK